MSKIIVVIDVELDKADWPLRNQIMESLILRIINDAPIGETGQLKATHMKGMRIILENKEQVLKFINGHNLGKFDLPTIKQSETQFASIFFVNWPMNLEEKLPKLKF